MKKVPRAKMRQNRAVLGWPWMTSCFACISYDETGAFFVSLSWVNLCGDKVVSVRTKLAPNKYAWYRRQKLNTEHCFIPSSPSSTVTQSVFSSPWCGYQHTAAQMHGKFSICHDSMTALLKVLHCDIHHSKCTTANSMETERKLFSAHNTFQWRY